MPSPATAAEGAHPAHGKLQASARWAKRNRERCSSPQGPAAPSLEATLLAIARKVQGELLQSLEAEARELLDSVSSLQVQGKRQLIMLDHLEEMVERCCTLAAGGPRLPGSCEERGAIAEADCEGGSAGRADAGVPAAAGPGTENVPTESLAFDGEGAALRFQHGGFFATLEPVMPTPPEALLDFDEMPGSPGRVPTPPDPEEKMVEESCQSKSSESLADPETADEAHVVSQNEDPVGHEKSRTWWMDEVSKLETGASCATMHHRLERANFMRSFVLSNRFDTICGAMILLNLLSMGIEANHSAMNPHERCNSTFMVLDLVFSAFFFAELILRLAVLRKSYFIGEDWRWNWFDLFLILCTLTEEVIRQITRSDMCEERAINKGADALSIIRVLRMLRILRSLRVLQLVRELRIMIHSAMECILPLCWALLLLLIIQWSFGIYFVRMSADYFHDMLAYGGALEKSDLETMASIRLHWGTIWQACYTLFQSITGGTDWANGADIMMVMGVTPVLVFVIYISLTVFVFLNVVTGVFVEHAMKIILRDRDLRVDMELEQQKECIESLVRIFNDVDADCDGWVGEEEFETGVEDKQVQASLDCLGLTGAEAKRLFRLLDVDESGCVSRHEFVTGCMTLRGTAKTLDVVSLMLDFQKFAPRISSEIAHLKSVTDEIRGLQSAPAA